MENMGNMKNLEKMEYVELRCALVLQVRFSLVLQLRFLWFSNKDVINGLNQQTLVIFYYKFSMFKNTRLVYATTVYIVL